MRYLIDGYNLLHAMGLLQGRLGPHGLEKARLALLSRLYHTCAAASSITVVFDARHAPPGVLPEEDYRGIHVCYTRECEADDRIEEMIRLESTPRRLTIISDDHRVRDAGRRRQCEVLHCLDYLEALEKQRRQRPPAPVPISDKPETLSPDETERWLQEFDELSRDSRMHELFGPDFEVEDDE